MTVIKITRKPTWKDGSTAVVVLGINDTLYIANLGDSKVTVLFLVLYLNLELDLGPP